MAKAKGTNSNSKRRPPLSPEARENLMISLAMDQAEEELRNGTASSQVVTHFLKLGSSKAELEREKLAMETDMLKAKTESLQAQKKMDELYMQAINAMKKYSGNGDDDDYEDYY